jgi:KEOPS complex subunit Cgi121
MSKRTILITGLISNDPIDVKALLKKVEQVAKELGIELQLVDASKVYGKEHLEIAAEKAIRAFDEGRNFGKTLAVEVILYASGKRQISEALRFMGLHEGIKELGAVAIAGPGDKIPPDIEKRLGLERNDDILKGSDDVLEAFGIGPEMRKGIPKVRWGDLVLERVSLLDIEK